MNRAEAYQRGVASGYDAGVYGDFTVELSEEDAFTAAAAEICDNKRQFADSPTYDFARQPAILPGGGSDRRKAHTDFHAGTTLLDRSQLQTISCKGVLKVPTDALQGQPLDLSMRGFRFIDTPHFHLPSRGCFRSWTLSERA